MKKKIRLAALAAAAGILCSCGTADSAALYDAAAAKPAAVSQNSSGSLAADEQTTPQTTTTATTATAVTETSPDDLFQPENSAEVLFSRVSELAACAANICGNMELPAKLSGKVLENRRFTCEGFPKYVFSNKKLDKALSNIDSICQEYGGNISFAYCNVRTGAVCYYRPDVYYGSCSTIKAPYCAAVLESKADLDEKLTVKELWHDDPGRISKAGTGKKYTARELIRYAVTESDNSAYLTLVNRYGYGIFNDMNNKLGADYYLSDGYIFTECTARQLLKEYIHIYESGESRKRMNWLTRLMQKTDFETQITAQLGEKYPVSHKYGSDAIQQCYHDCAICYADSPFVLVILTKQVPETPESNKVFKKLAKQFDIVNEQLISF